MIAIVHLGKLFLCFDGCHFLLFGKSFNFRFKILFKLAFRNSAERRIFAVQTDVVKLVQTAENIYVAYFCNSSDKKKTDVFVRLFQRTVKIPEFLTVLFFKIRVKGVKNRLVVFVDEDYDFFTLRLFTCSFNQSGKTDCRVIRLFFKPKQTFILCQNSINDRQKLVLSFIRTASKTNLQNRILGPFFFKRFNRKTFEQFLFAKKIRFHSGKQKAFPEPARTA